MVAPVKIEWDKKSVAKGGQVRITGYDPFAANNEWTAKASDGNEYRGAEVTSEGFQIFGLPPYAYYSAGYACYMTGPGSKEWMQDNHDVWKNHMDLAGIKNGGIVGFKYFGFGGLAQTTKGVPAFEGTQKAGNTQLNLFLTPGGHGAFKIHVMLDGPYANSTWNGREIAVLDVPANAPREARNFTLPVEAVDGLTGKHAIYLVVEGPEIEQPQQPEGRPQFGRRQGSQRPQGLFDLHGIGFSKAPFAVVPNTEAPEITITVDGKRLAIPATPLYSTNANGYTDCAHYQLYAPLSSSSKIQATSPTALPAVQFEVSPIAAGRATVKATWKGKTKTYLIN